MHMRIGIDDILAGHGIHELAGDGGRRFVTRTERREALADTATMAIPLTLEYDPENDMLLLFQNTIYMQVGADYTVAANAQSIQSVKGVWEKGTTFDFIALSDMKTDFPSYDGTLIKDGSITEEKLSNEIRNRIAASVDYEAVLGQVDAIEEQARQMREAAADAKLQVEAADLVTAGSSFGGHGIFTFGVPYHDAKTTTNAALTVGTAVLTGKVAAYGRFALGERVTIFDDVNLEVVTVTKATATELEVSALTKAYKGGAVIGRSTFVRQATGNGFTFPTWGNIGVLEAHLRLTPGTTDECVLWLTHHKDLTVTLRAKFGTAAEVVVPAGAPFALDASLVVVQYLMTNTDAADLTLDLRVRRSAPNAPGKLNKYIGGIG